MKRLLTPLVLALVLLAAAPLRAAVTDAPHNDTNRIHCTDCHSYSLWWEFSPVDSDAALKADKVSTICLGCHGDSGPEIGAATHSSLAMGSLHRDELGDWGRVCTDCHDPHFQAQLDWQGTVADADLYVVRGTLDPATISVGGDGSAASPYQSTFAFTNITTQADWDNATTPWSAKNGVSGRGLILALPATAPFATFEVAAVNEAMAEITVNGRIDAAMFSGDVDFGLVYGQLIRSQVQGASGPVDVKFFTPYGGFVDQSGVNQGLCQACHSQTNHFTHDAGDAATDHRERADDRGETGADSRCTYCHKHTRGFAPGSDGGKHPEHLAMGVDCNVCHTVGMGTMDPLTAPGCDTCHQDGRGGPPNDTDYRSHWNDPDPSYSLNCASCHNGRLLAGDIDTVAPVYCDTARSCDECHRGATPSCGTGQPCASCHTGDGSITGLPASRDRQAPPVGMQTGGHARLAGSQWIRQYPCWYCHTDTVDQSWNLKAKHLNGAVDVVLDSEWAIAGIPDPPAYDAANKTCRNLYCHSDGTSVDPELRDYAWDGGHQECNSCHGHKPSAGGCNASGCHTDGRDGSYWDRFPEKKWLSAMPMYQNTGPLTDKANSHYRHLFTGYSCDDCHADTIAGGSCLDCHGTTIPSGDMNEKSHINPRYHVNRVKNIVFKDGGTYNPTEKSCSATACHTGSEPRWGGSVHDAIVCRDCHGATDGDVDDFGKFNGTRAKIDLNQWADSGHGRPGVIDPATGLPDPSVNPYPSGNPPANFPDNGCWYCHDSRVLHQDEERPFRLIRHEHFQQRFEKECVFCHMTGEDNECLGCHNDTESLAPQLADITSPEDHTGYVDGRTSCVSACHPDDASRHRTGAGIWSAEEKDDVKNAYVQMGVCLICHDDDSSGECNTCHSGPQYALGFDPADNDPGLAGSTAGRIVAQASKASSSHFGYKHYQDFIDSENAVIDSGAVSETSTSVHLLVDTSKSWTPGQFDGRRLRVTSGVNNGMVLPIVRNTADTLTLAPSFPPGRPVEAGDTYEILDQVWKGGKFCWDCHDPHGDNNIYMIQDKVATRTDGVVGKPIERRDVSFTRKTTGLDYARINPDPITGEYNGICNVCHTNSEMHYTRTKGDNHNSGRVCTECHEHRFTNSHASNQPCNTCHRNRPVPRHTAFSQARDCTKCHKDAIGNRMNIMKQFNANSHHVQGIPMTNRQCYACHWEATPEGVINLEHHSGYNYKTHESTPDAPVDLVIWGPGQRPEVFDNDGAGGDDTAVSFLAANIDVSKPGVTVADQRAEVAKVTRHCLGCHSDQNNDTEPFGDCKTPRQYAWDRSSIASRYSNPGTATWGKYSGPNVADKSVTKAFSAHGNAVANQGGWDPDTGVDETIPNTRDGSYNVQCFDCHSSHGSMVEGVTSSYVTFNGTRNGANLKETQAGKGGYQMNYMASSNPDPNAVNPYQAGAGQCFDCHESESSGTDVSPVAKTPWGYGETFGAAAPIIGYKDNPRFSGSYPGKRFPYRDSRHTLGGHFKASHTNPESPNYDMSGASDVPATGSIDGLCTPCHDPHGVSPSLGDKMAYAVPMLKGTWLSSYYKEDAPPMMDDGYNGSSGFYNGYNNWPGNAPRPYPQKADPQPTGVWRTDRNTFNTVDLSVKANKPDYTRVAEEAEVFAGLCLRCHPKDTLTPDAALQATDDIPWATSERIHRSVKGWGWAAGERQREHSFVCSKCHQPHASGLPRLMKTNCLNYTHRGRVESGGIAENNDTLNRENYPGRFPYGWWDNGVFEALSTGICHGADSANGPDGWPDNQRWNNVTPWEGGQ